MNEILKVIRDRRTTRKFKIEQIKEEELQGIIDAGLYAPSAHNQQSWNFTVIQDKELISKLSTSTKEMAKNIPDPIINKMANNEKFNIFYDAPTVILVSGKEENMMPEVDCAAATQNMLIAAESLDIGVCWNGFITLLFNNEEGFKEYKNILQIPEGFKPYYALAIGYKEVKMNNAPARRENTVQYIR
ncbi:MAG: nitroreductase family protein [Clostridium perfringens]|nr:nitroreductase family protein [Clostridium perfringens]